MPHNLAPTIIRSPLEMRIDTTLLLKDLRQKLQRSGLAFNVCAVKTPNKVNFCFNNHY